MEVSSDVAQRTPGTNGGRAEPVQGPQTAGSSMWVVVLNYNGWGDTSRCLDSLAPSADDSFSVVLVDNASVEPLPDDLSARYPWLHVVRNPRNDGYAGGNNRGIELALSKGATWIVLLNNDTVVGPDFGRECRIAACEAAKQGIDVWGPVIRDMIMTDVAVTDACIFNRRGYSGFFERLPVAESPDDAIAFVDTDIVNGCCLAASATLVRRIGMIDEGLFLMHEESDFCLRAAEAGARCSVLARALVWHKGSASFTRTGTTIQQYFDVRNLWYLVRRRPSAYRRGRSRLRSTAALLHHFYTRYTLEIEAHRPQCARAVVEGLYDAWAGVQGPYSKRRRSLLGALNTALNVTRVSMKTVRQVLPRR